MSTPLPALSRAHKKQLGVFLPADTHAWLRQYAFSRQMTFEEVVGAAVNRAAEGLTTATLSFGHYRLQRRVVGAAKPRNGLWVAPCRRRMLFVGGWFDRTEIDTLSAVFAASGLGMQEAVKNGIALLRREEGSESVDTGRPGDAVPADSDDGWSLGLPELSDEALAALR